MKRLRPKDLAEYLNDKKTGNETDRNETDTSETILLLDVREPWEYERCHLEGAKLIPMGQIVASIDQLDPEQETVVICHHGIRSLKVAQYLEGHGFTNLINLDGGVDAWSKEVDSSLALY